MRRWFSCLALLTLLIGLIGCGGDNAGLLPGAPVSTGTMTLRIAWPTSPAPARMIPAASEYLSIAVTGPGIGAPIVGELFRPETALSLTVPAGPDRMVSVVAYDADGMPLAHATQTGVTIQVNQATAVNLTLLGVEDPNDATHPVLIPLDAAGTGSAVAIIDSRATLEDWFVFTAKAGGSGYLVTITSLDVAQSPVYGGFTIDFVDDLDTIITTASRGFGSTGFDPVPLAVTPVTAGEVRIHLSPWFDLNGPVACRYRVTVTEGGSGNIDVAVQ
jgi:hypothetical protein